MDGVFEAANPTEVFNIHARHTGNSAHAAFSWALPYVTSPLQAGMTAAGILS